MNTMKLVRRAHLYTGLVLVPFVVLYGATGFLFNHPAVWSETEVQHLSAEQLSVDLSPADQQATQLIAQVPGLQVDPNRPAVWSKRASLRSGNHSLVWDGDGSRLYRRAPRQESETLRGITSERDPTQQLLGQAARLLPEEDWQVRSAPRLGFGVLCDGEPKIASYDPLKQTLTLRDPEPRSIRSFLLRMHKGHVYPANLGPDFWWAILVDVMGITMVIWALSGLCMWWQMKKLRRHGLLALGVCTVMTTALVAGQWG